MTLVASHPNRRTTGWSRYAIVANSRSADIATSPLYCLVVREYSTSAEKNTSSVQASTANESGITRRAAPQNAPVANSVISNGTARNEALDKPNKRTAARQADKNNGGLLWSQFG